MQGQKVKVHLGKHGACYGITTGRTKQLNDIDIIELDQCNPIPFHEIDLFRDGFGVSFNVKFANEIQVYKNEEKVYPEAPMIRYYKLKKNCFNENS